ncbi:hypothetical protein MCO_00576, partial [Bartonella sp. DB5-6]
MEEVVLKLFSLVVRGGRFQVFALAFGGGVGLEERAK